MKYFQEHCAVPLGVEHAKFLEDLSDDGDSRVYGVGDDQDESLGSRGGDSGRKVLDNSGVDLTYVC